MKKKTIFTTITLGLVTLLGLGFLGAINSQPKEAKASEITTQPTKKYKQVTSGDLDSTKTYYAVAKNAINNGEGTFYQGSITLENSAMTGTTGLQYNIQLSCTLIRNSNQIYNNTYFTMNSRLSGGTYRLYSVYFDRIGYIYTIADTYFNRELCAFIFKNATLLSGDISFLYQFFNVYDLTDFAETYNFNEQFNFNNFYQIDNNFFAQPLSAVVGATTSTSINVKTLNVGNFYSGGLVFNQIRAYFNPNLLNSKFETGPNSNVFENFPTNTLNAYNYYFNKLEYVNTYTNLTIVVCNRVVYEKEGTSYFYFLPAWAGNEYKELYFISRISSLFTRAVFNSLTNNEQLSTPVQYENAGLSSAFNLIGQAFTAWLPILQISVVPGITIGLLLFLPLMAGIIIFIIWIVKR